MRHLLLTTVLSTFVAASLSHAIVGRHDVDLVATGEQALRFAAVGQVLPDGEAVLVAPQWVLTAAHVATSTPGERLRVRFGGIDYRIAEVIPYPGWEPGHHDIAGTIAPSARRDGGPCPRADIPRAAGKVPLALERKT